MALRFLRDLWKAVSVLCRVLRGQPAGRSNGSPPGWRGGLSRVSRSWDRTGDQAGALKLQRTDGLWHIRIGDYRVIYAIDGRTHVVDIGAVRHRRDEPR